MTVPAVKYGFRLESRAAALERFVERHQIWILAIWSLIYFAGTMLRAHGKPFWYDEVLTLLEARQPTLPQALRAFGDLDWMPRPSHFTFYFTNKLTGAGEVAFRIPVMIGLLGLLYLLVPVCAAASEHLLRVDGLLLPYCQRVLSIFL